MDEPTEQTGSCICCARRDPIDPPVCNLCRHRVAARLWELRDLHALLSAALGPGQSQQQRVSGSREAPLPLRVEALDYAAAARPSIDGVTDVQRDQRGVWGVADILDSWARDWSERRGEDMPSPEVPAIVSWMSTRLTWALDHHPAVDEFAAELLTMVYGLRTLLNVSRKPIYLDDACPSCAHTALRRDPGGGDVECGHCRRVWPHEEFERLAVVLAPASNVIPVS